jgi:hypothetical protein
LESRPEIDDNPLARGALFTAVVLGLWLVFAGPAYLLAGTNGLEGLSYAAVLCFLPGLLVFYLSSRYRVASTRALVLLAGTGVRLVFVLGGMLVIQSVRQNLRFREFIIWLLAFYLATLVAETLLVIRPASGVK